MKEAEDLVILDGISLVSEWPLELAESLLDDSTPWWGSWPGDPTDEPNRGPDFAQLVNCVYGYCRYAHKGDLKLLYGASSDFSTRCSISPTQQILDALYFTIHRERFGYGHIRKHERLMRQALQEVVSRVHSEHPPQFLAVTRLPHLLMYEDTQVGVLIPYESHSLWVSCHFVPDPAFTQIQPLFEEAYQLTKNWKEDENQEGWKKAYEKVAALDLSLVREDGKKGELSSIHIHNGKASFRLLRQRVIC